jgi:ribose transport system substrate-binding protein
MPPKGVVDQKRMMETLLAKGIDGIAVSPVDAENQTPFLNEVAENTILITNDSDAPKSKPFSLYRHEITTRLVELWGDW